MRLIVSKPGLPEWSTLASGQTDIEDELDTCSRFEPYSDVLQNGLTAGVCGEKSAIVFVSADVDGGEPTGAIRLTPRCTHHATLWHGVTAFTMDPPQ